MSSGVVPSHWLVGFAPGGMVPVQFSVTVWPVVVGTVADWVWGSEAPAVSGTATATAAADTRAMALLRRMGLLEGYGRTPGRHARASVRWYVDP